LDTAPVVDKLAEAAVFDGGAKQQVRLGSVEVVRGDQDGAAGRRWRGRLRLRGHGIGGRREQQAGANFNAKSFHGSSPGSLSSDPLDVRQHPRPVE
jgi:hypothetical protein